MAATLSEAESEPAAKPCAAVPTAAAASEGLIAAVMAGDGGHTAAATEQQQVQGNGSQQQEGSQTQQGTQQQQPQLQPRQVQPYYVTESSKKVLRTLTELSAAEGMAQQTFVVYFSWSKTRSLARVAVETLAASMEADPVDAWLTGKGRCGAFARKEVAGYLQALPKASHFIATPDASAAALWQLLPTETPRNELLAGWTRVLQVPIKRWRALLDIELAYERAHASVTASHGSYYYLSFIGTLPAARGKGYGSLLLRHMTRQADEEGRVCMLEATSDRSRALYERHGFAVYNTFRVRSKAPPIYFMLRLPGSQQAATQAVEQKAATAAALENAAASTVLIGAVHSVAQLTQSEQQQRCQQQQQQLEAAHMHHSLQPVGAHTACLVRTASKHQQQQQQQQQQHKQQQLMELNDGEIMVDASALQHWGSGLSHVAAATATTAT